MENSTPGVTGTDKSPDRIEHEMEATRGAITEKVAALESQVLGTIQTATDNIQTVTSAVTDTVQAVKDAVSSAKDAVSTAPTAVSDTVKQTVAAVRDSVRETVGSFSLSECVRENPFAAIGTSAAVGFLTGFLFGGGSRSGGGLFGRPLMARGNDTPAAGGRIGGAHTAYAGHDHIGPAHAAAEPGFFGGLIGMVGKELRQVAEQALTTAVASLKQTVNTQVPQMVDAAVHQVADRVTSVAGGAGSHGAHGTDRVGGPNYTAAAPAI